MLKQFVQYNVFVYLWYIGTGNMVKVRHCEDWRRFQFLPIPLLHKEHFGVLLRVFEPGPALRSMSFDKAKLKVDTKFA